MVWNKNISTIPVIISCLILLSSCNQTNNYKTEVTSLYSVVKTNEKYEYRSDDRIYKDSIIYQTEFIPLEKFIFDEYNKIAGLEVYDKYQKNSNNITSTYKDSEGNILSNYNHILDDKNRRIRIEGFESGTNFLSRVEEISYNDLNLINVRKIFDGTGRLATSYTFQYDKNGNELNRVTQHLLRDTIITEKSEIVKYDSQNRWVEKWGFLNNQPRVYYKRQIKKG